MHWFSVENRWINFLIHRRYFPSRNKHIRARRIRERNREEPKTTNSKLCTIPKQHSQTHSHTRACSIHAYSRYSVLLLHTTLAIRLKIDICRGDFSKKSIIHMKVARKKSSAKLFIEIEREKNALMHFSCRNRNKNQHKK